MIYGPVLKCRKWVGRSKKIVRGQSKHGLWDCNLKTGKFLPGGAQEQI